MEILEFSKLLQIAQNATLMSEIFASRKFRESARLTHFAGINFREIGFSQTKTLVKLAIKPIFIINKQKNNQENVKMGKIFSRISQNIFFATI